MSSHRFSGIWSLWTSCQVGDCCWRGGFCQSSANASDKAGVEAFKDKRPPKFTGR